MSSCIFLFMNSSELRRSVQEALVQVEKTLLKKNEEYATDSDVFRISELA